MANLTIDDAITKVRQLLDDTSTTVPRWTDAQVKDALADSLNSCLVRYATEGGDRFDLETTATTSATTGSASIVSVLPLLIKQVSIVIGDTTYRLPPKDRMRRGFIDLNARSLVVLYVREYALSSTTTHPLVGVGAAEANSWRAFDRWICYETAMQLTSKDVEAARIEWIQTMASKSAAECMARATTPSGYVTPRPEWNPSYGDISWQMVQPATIYLTRTRW